MRLQSGTKGSIDIKEAWQCRHVTAKDWSGVKRDALSLWRALNSLSDHRPDLAFLVLAPYCLVPCHCLPAGDCRVAGLFYLDSLCRLVSCSFSVDILDLCGKEPLFLPEHSYCHLRAVCAGVALLSEASSLSPEPSLKPFSLSSQTVPPGLVPFVSAKLSDL